MRDHLTHFATIVSSGWREAAFDGPILSTSEALLTFLQIDMGSHEVECLRILCLDGDNRLLDDRIMWQGTVDRVPAYPREVVRHAIDTGATALILVHNHPRGDPRPSDEDWILTDRIASACAAIDVVVHDHLIIGNDSAFSMAMRKPLAVRPSDG